MTQAPTGSPAHRLVERVVSGETDFQALLLYGNRGTDAEALSESLARYWLGKGGAKVPDDLSRAIDFQRIRPTGNSEIIKVGAITPSTGPDSSDDEKETPVVPVTVFFRTRPLMSPHKVLWFDRPDRMNSRAANALLKTLEELPDYARVVMTTTEIGRVLPTIRSRCLCAAVEAVPLSELVDGPKTETESLFASTQGDLAFIRGHQDLFEDLARLLRQTETAPPLAAIRLAEQTKEIIDKLADKGKIPTRLAAVRVLESIGQWMARNAPHDAASVQRTAELAGYVQGNGNLQLALNVLFAQFLTTGREL
jgi:DNA polymerase III delta prime subunit